MDADAILFRIARFGDELTVQMRDVGSDQRKGCYLNCLGRTDMLFPISVRQDRAISGQFPARTRLLGRHPLRAYLVDHLFAHHELLRLASGGEWKIRDETDVARYLVMGDLALAETADFFVGRRLAGL